MPQPEQPEQSYANHVRIVPGFHRLLPAVLVAALVGALYVCYRQFTWGGGRVLAVTLVLLVVAGGLLTWYTRAFALKAQDRAIRAEENLRHYVLTGKLLDPRLRMGQIVALRFAGDEELPALAARAAGEGMQPRDIKQAVRAWRADHHRV